MQRQIPVVTCTSIYAIFERVEKGSQQARFGWIVGFALDAKLLRDGWNALREVLDAGKTGAFVDGLVVGYQKDCARERYRR